MPENDSRQKYQVNFPLANGQAYELITHMPLKAIEDEIDKSRSEGTWAKFDCVNPFDDSKVDVRIDSSQMTGLVFRPWVRPAPQQMQRPNLVQ